MRLVFLIIFLIYCNLSAQRNRDDVEELKRINVTEKLGEFIPLGVELVNEQGEKVLLADYFKEQQPVIFTFAYYECPMLCSQVLNAVAASVDRMDWESKNRYKVITVSIDSAETYSLAAEKKKFYLKEIKDPDIKENWTFFTAPQKSIDTLTKAMGFEYYYVEERDEFAHPAVVFVLSPDGKISRYLYGLNYEPKDLKLALLEAAEGKIGNTLDKLILFCFHYDANSNTYVLFAQNVMRLGGVLTMIALFSFLAVYWVKERKKTNKENLKLKTN